MQSTLNSSNTKLYEAAYFVESSKKSFPLDHSIAVRPLVSSDLIQWGDTQRKFICIEGDSDKLQVYLPDDEVITLSKLTVEVYNRYFNCKPALQHLFISNSCLQTYLLEEKPDQQPENRFTIALDSSLNDYADTLNFGTPVPAEQFSPEEKKENFKDELKTALTHPAIKINFISAFQLIFAYGNSTLQDTFANAKKILETLDLATVQDQEVCEILHLTEETIEGVFNLAIAKYNDQQYPESQALFYLLTTLKPYLFDLWYRSGIVAQDSGNYSYAIKSYSNALILKPELLEAHLFSIECYLDMGMEQKAQKEYEKLNKRVAELPHSEENSSLLEEAKSLLT